MGGETKNQTEHAKLIGKIESEVHTLNTLVKTLFEKFDAYVEKSQPKQLGPAGYIGLAGGMIMIIASLFGSMIYINNSANAPIVTALTQVTQTLASMQNRTMLNANQNQLTSKELSGLAKSVVSNDGTLNWLLYDENIPKKVTILEQQMKFVLKGK